MIDNLIAELKRKLHYDPNTGVFTRLVTVSGKGSRQGTQAGHINAHSGYRQIHINGQQHQAHRLAWLYVHGVFPPEFIDHVNRDRADNRLANLRRATRKQNGENQNMSISNTSGYKGVSWSNATRKWVAQIRHNGKSKYLGTFFLPAEASDAYQKAAAELFTHKT